MLGRFFSLTLALTSLTACATTRGNDAHHATSKRDASPEARYRAAVLQKFAGDAQGYYAALLDLATNEPESLGGRRARSTLRSSDFLTTVMTLNAFAGMFTPLRGGLVTENDTHVDEGLLRQLLGDVQAPSKKDSQLADDAAR